MAYGMKAVNEASKQVEKGLGSLETAVHNLYAIMNSSRTEEVSLSASAVLGDLKEGLEALEELVAGL